VSSTAGADYKNDNWNTKSRDTLSDCVGNWVSAGRVSSGAEEKADAWGTKGSNDNSKRSDGWGAGSGASWDKPSFSLVVEEPAWSKPRFSDDNNGNSRGGFGRGNRGRGRVQSFGDSRDFDGSRGRGRGRFGRGGRNEGNNFGSGDGGSWGSGRGNSGRGGYRNWNDDNERRPFSQGGGWSQSSDWNNNKGTSDGDQGFSKSKPLWGSDNNDSWGAPKPSGGDDRAGNNWSQNIPSSSVLGQPSGNKNCVAWGALSDTTIAGGAGDKGSWGQSNDDSWNSSRGTGGTEKSSWGGSETAPKKDGLLEQGKGSGGGSSWDRSDDPWNNNKGSASGNGGR
jgi:hypothetical protein